MTTLSVTTIPKSRADGGSVRFFPVVTGATVPIFSYAWNFGNGTTSTDAAPIAVYSGATTFTFTASLTTTDTLGGTASATTPIPVTSGAFSSVTAGVFQSVSVFIYNTDYIMVNRNPTAFCKLYLLNPVVTDTIDISTTSTFSVLVPTNATTERDLIVEGSNVIFLQGGTITFSGVIKRATQDLQGSYSATTPIQKWDFECDNDLRKLTKINANAASLQAGGATIVLPPGEIARLILNSSWYGDIFCNDPVIEYRVNSTNLTEQVPSQYEQIMSLQSLTNYDLRARMDYKIYTCSAFNGTNQVSVASALLTAGAFVGQYVFFPNSATGCKTWGKVTSNTTSTITCSMSVGDAATPAWFIVTNGERVDFAPNLSTISDVATFGVNDTVFEYSDNDDKRKLYTKVIAKGKDIQGKNISVSLSGVHAYDYDKQFYKDCSFITKKSEGYVYSNTYVRAYESVTILPVASNFVWSSSAGYPTEVTAGGMGAVTAIGGTVTFSVPGGSTLPTALTAGVDYYVVEAGGGYCKVSDTPGGTPLDVYTGKTGTTWYINTPYGTFTVSNLVFSEGQIVKFGGTTAPTGITFGVSYTLRDVIPTTGTGGAFHLQTYAPTTAGTSVYVYAPSDAYNIKEGTVDTAQVTLYGWGYEIDITDTVVFVFPSGTYTGIVLLDTGTEIQDSAGNLLTQFTFTQSNPPLTTDYSGRGYLLCSKLWVNDKSIYTSGAVDMLVGEELISITSSGTDTSRGNYLVCDPIYRIPSDTVKAYPHGVGALIALNNYTEATPETFSVVADYGLHINTVTVETNTTYGQLDSYATNLLLGFGAFYKKATCWMPIQYAQIKRAGETAISPNIVTMPRLGDMFGIIETIGATPLDYQIVAKHIKYDEGRIEFQLGDYEKNVFLSIQKQTSGLNQTLT